MGSDGASILISDFYTSRAVKQGFLSTNIGGGEVGIFLTVRVACTPLTNTLPVSRDMKMLPVLRSARLHARLHVCRAPKA